eukprot:TRINITY_DN7943_c0_g1_i1.p1 TRINITY_DN7943_c0_g1~~TRINITY_DN7943_c0_g1_i1.p1  ORF type:complete len:451 (+),score=58.99 TRINITY_DN7943_c0_g1_i1:123-1355(+)
MALNVAVIPVGDALKWDDTARGVMLSSFYWGYIVTQVPGGWMAKKYGPKILFGWGVGWASFLTILWPFTRSSFGISLFLRILTGLGEGVTFPAVYHLISQWYPKMEKSTITSVISIAPTLGIVIANGLSPAIINNLRWESIFFLYGGVGIVWSVFWLLLAIDYPSDNSSISLMRPSTEEIQFILDNQEIEEDHSSNISIYKILTTPAYLAIIFNHFSYNWAYYIFASWLPTYLKKQLQFDLDSAGAISMLPYLLMTVVGISSGYFADKLITRNIFSVQVVRKIFQLLGTLLPSMFLVLLSTLPNLSVTTTVAIMFSALATAPFTMAGHSSNFLDITNKYCGLLYSISNAVATIPGIVGVYLTGYILNVSNNNWNIVFLLAASLSFLAAIIFTIFAKGELLDFDDDEKIIN